MEEVSNPQTTNSQQQVLSVSRFKILIIGGLIMSFTAAFASGFALSTLLRNDNLNPPPPIPVTSVAPTVIPVSSPESDEPKETDVTIIPGKQQKYFLDTVFIIEKATPHRAIIASVSRSEADTNFLQNARISFYDGTNWYRELHSLTTTSDSIASDKLVKSWNITIDPSRVLKESVSGELFVHGTSISFTSEPLFNEIGMRSLPDYTKFMSEGTGTAQINDQQIPVYILYTKIYSMDVSKIQFYSQPMGVITDWVAFWDDQGNFYHIDTTEVGKPSPIYNAHHIVVAKNTKGSITKSFSVHVTRDGQTVPNTANFIIETPLERSLHLNRLSYIDKSVPNKYNWYMSLVDGDIKDDSGRDIKGFGLYEFIQDLQ